jgi:hypothetical protein
MLGLVSAPIPWYAMTNIYIGRSNTALWRELVILSTSTLSYICWREYSLTVDGIQKLLPSRNKVSLALDAWTLKNKVANISVITYDLDQN